MKLVWAILAVILLVSAIILPVVYDAYVKGEAEDTFFFGVAFGGDTTAEAKLLIDKVKGYTNLFIINHWDVSMNETALNEISQYAVDANLSIIVYFDFIPYQTYPWLHTFLTIAKEMWGNKFLGVYLYDEPGGKQIDTGQWRSGTTAAELFENVSDYNGASNRFIAGIPSGPSWQFAENNNISRFTSDYALYWFDYLAGYDAVFAELGWDHNRTQHIALNRGAANVQNKDWGTIIVWNSRDPGEEDKGTYKTGPEMYGDIIASYSAGAKYVVIFDYPYDQPFGILDEEHFDAMETFWNMTRLPEQDSIEKVEADVAFVLPKDYGWGMRHLNDKIWGVWPADEDELAPLIWDNMNKLIDKYGLRLDIIYNDIRFDFEKKYSEIYYWNSQIP